MTCPRVSTSRCTPLSILVRGLGLLTFSETWEERLKLIKYEAMRAALGCTRDRSIVTMRFLLEVVGMYAQHRLPRFVSYLKLANNEQDPSYQS